MLAHAQSNGPAVAPPAAKATAPAAFRAPAASFVAARIRLEAPDPAAILALRQANARASTKRLEIGIGREVSAEAHASAVPRWVAAAGGRAAHWQVASAEARALRVALSFARTDTGAQLRFAGSDRPDVVYGPVTAADILEGGTYWSPVLEGETATIEVFVPGASPDPGITIAQLSHLFVSPADPKAESLAKAAQACEVNFICRASTDASLAQTGKSVARMAYTAATGGTGLCTGTLLNPADASFTPYFISGAHCISTQASASTLTLYWFYETAACTSTALNPPLNPAAIQVPGGATLLYANAASDVSFMRLNTPPPAAAVYAGWDATTVSPGAAVTAIHHPDGDLKKVSLGAIAGFDTSELAPGSFIRVQWNSIATGVTEPGSSGGGIFTGNASAGYRFRGGLLGGASDCFAPPAELFDHYSRLDHAYPFIAQYLNPANAPALGANALANPGFEGGASGWTQASSGGASIITNDPAVAHSGSWYAWLGGATDVTETLSQLVAIPQGPARLQFWYRIATAETTTSRVFDSLTVALVNPATGATLATLGTLSNLNATSGWVQSPVYDVSASAGQSVRLQFRATNDISEPTSFRIDDVTLNATLVFASANQTALWWNASESGWGLNVNNQGNVAFATLFTYDAAGAPMWLVMPSGQREEGADTFIGALYRTTGSPFNANPFPPIGAGNIAQVGSMTLDFSAPGATLGYTINNTYVSKSIQKQVFGARAAECLGTSGSRAGAANYQDLWWNAAESGWGLNITHQGNTVFATLFTYGANGQGLWLVLPSGALQSDGSYAGELYRTSGPVFNAQPWSGIGFSAVGTMRLRFQSGEAGTLEYSVNGVNVSKAISRQVFSSPAPLCAG